MALKVAVLLTGSGTTLQNIIDRIDEGRLDAEVCCVISSRKTAFGLERARKHDIPAIAVSRKSYEGPEDFDLPGFSGAIWDAVRSHGAELVVLAGFMSLLTIPQDFKNRIMNVHAALIPSFCGQGMWGHHVYEAVLEYGAKVTGATVHFVDERYDHGPIILQAPVPVEEGDTVETLAQRVQAVEREIYPQAIQLYAEGRVEVAGRIVHIR
jgi:phosphoribosylglycinamide formyltransferase-1